MGRGVASIADVVEEVRDLIPGLPRPDPVEPQVRRFLFFEAVTSLLIRAARQEPLLVLIDNLNSADHPSLHLLEFLSQAVQSGRMLVLVTYRDLSLSASHPLIPTLGELARQPSYRQLRLAQLSAGEVADLVRAVTRADIHPQLAGALHERTEGNPLYVAEMAKLLRADDLRQYRDNPSGLLERLEIPDTVQLAIAQRLSRLPDSCREVLATAAAWAGQGSWRAGPNAWLKRRVKADS